MDVPMTQMPPQARPMPLLVQNSSRLKRRFLFIFVACLGVAGVAILALIFAFPSETSLLFNSLLSVASNPSQSKTFSGPGVTFYYPANWVNVNISMFKGILAQQNVSVNNSKFSNKSQIAVIVPASEVLGFAGQAPELLAQYLTNPTNFTIPQNISFVAAGAIKAVDQPLPSGYLPIYTILDADPNAVVNDVNVGGYSGFHVEVSNQQVFNVTIPFAELSFAEVNGSICFTFAFATQQSQIASINQSFTRAAQTIACNFQQVGTSVPPPIIDKFLSLLG